MYSVAVLVFEPVEGNDNVRSFLSIKRIYKNGKDYPS